MWTRLLCWLNRNKDTRKRRKWNPFAVGYPPQLNMKPWESPEDMVGRQFIVGKSLWEIEFWIGSDFGLDDGIMIAIRIGNA